MLNERKASALKYDPGNDTATIDVEGCGASVRRYATVASLLLDEQGHLVGIDVEPDHTGRVVVMFGPHEKVASQKPANVEISRDAGGGPTHIMLRSAKAARANEPNPYLR